MKIILFCIDAFMIIPPVFPSPFPINDVFPASTIQAIGIAAAIPCFPPAFPGFCPYRRSFVIDFLVPSPR
ncbi:hypothetical protein [Candidatus Deferrimicrobium sp.]|uniref:hypothetical protein n=1 Tax=Candidatus Deferrimicrobium sp. TaxID=3060586 RepID=UPI002ED081DF